VAQPPRLDGRLIWSSGAGVELAPWSVHWAIGDP
jgi:hypothetical protein